MRDKTSTLTWLGVAAAVTCAPAWADKPLRVGLVDLRPELWQACGAGDPQAVFRASAERNRAALPTEIGGRAVELRTLTLGRDSPELDICDVVALLPEWTLMLPALDEHAEAFHKYVNRGGGLVVFQPNPLTVYPQGAKPPKALAECGISDSFCTPKLLPLPATFYNWYVRGEAVRRIQCDHPIAAGLTDFHMPFPTDRMFDLDGAYEVLATGRTSLSPSLAAAKFGDGRIVLIADNVGGTQWWGSPTTVVRRSLLWAAGGRDEQVRGIIDPPPPLWPTEDAAEAARAGTLRLEVAAASERIAPFQGVDLQLKLINTSDKAIRVPGNWSVMLGAEIAPLDSPGRILCWMPEVDYQTRRRLAALDADQERGLLYTKHWLACRPLSGLPAEAPYLPPGRYRFRLVLWGAPEVASGWRELEVAQPPPDGQARALAARRPEGRCLIVDGGTNCPVPDGGEGRPYSSAAQALAAARSGDVVYLRPGLHPNADLSVPDDVWLVGAGAAVTALSVCCPQAMGAGVKLCGQSRLEGLTVYTREGPQGHLVRAEGKSARPTLSQCLLIPADNDFCGLGALQGAAPVLRNCAIVSPLGDYAVFARNGASASLEYCTIISRGFGVGLMDGSRLRARRCIIAGQCPGILLETSCGLDIAQSILWCKGGGATFRYPITRHGLEPNPTAPNGFETVTDAVKEVMQQTDIHVIDPRFVPAGHIGEYLAVPDSSDAAAYGAWAGDGLTRPATANTELGVKLPDLSQYVGSRPSDGSGAARPPEGGPGRG